MFKIFVGATKGIIKGCPVAGIAAIDFRRQHNLPVGEDNEFKIDYICGITCETLVRKLVDPLSLETNVYVGFNTRISALHEVYRNDKLPPLELSPVFLSSLLAVLSRISDLLEEHVAILEEYILAVNEHVDLVRIRIKELDAAYLQNKKEEDQRKLELAYQTKVERQAQMAQLRAYMTPNEIFMLERNRLNLDEVIARLQDIDLLTLSTLLENTPAPEGCADMSSIQPGHVVGYQDYTWRASLAPTIEFIEKTLGQTVENVVTDGNIHLLTHTKLAWKESLLPITITFKNEDCSGD